MEKVAPQLVAVPAPTKGCLDLRCQDIKDGLDPVPAAHRQRAESLSKASVSHCLRKNIQHAEYAIYIYNMRNMTNMSNITNITNMTNMANMRNNIHPLL